MRNWEERRKEDERFWGDVVYEAYRQGRDSDAVDRDAVADAVEDLGYGYPVYPEPEEVIPHVFPRKTDRQADD
jgi:hypothetical protein